MVLTLFIVILIVSIRVVLENENEILDLFWQISFNFSNIERAQRT